jgi:hypothetical protein
MHRGVLKGFGGVLVVAALWAFPASAGADAAPLSFTGVGDEPMPAVFASSRGGDAIGSLPLIVQAGADTSGQLSLRFLPQLTGKGPVKVVPAAGAPASAPVVVRGSKLPRIGKRGAVPLVVVFRMPHGQSPSLADGTLLARVTPDTGKPVSATLSVSGRLGQVDILPPKVTLQHTKGCPGSCGHDSADLRITGPGTQALPQTGVIGTAVLSGDRSGTSSVELTRDHDKWTLTRTDSTLGQKSGKLPLVTGVANPPQIDVVVEDGVWFGIAVIVVLAGALVGSLLIPYYGIARRRGILGNALKAALQRYKEAGKTAEAQEAASGGPHVPRPAGYPLSGELGGEDSWNSRGCQPYQGPRGVRALLCRIATSRSDGDFGECEKEASDLISAIDGWIALEPVIAQAQRTLEEAKAVDPKDGKSFADSQVCVDLGQLIDEAVLFRPADLVEVEKKANRLRSQATAVVKTEAVWKAKAQVLAMSGPLTDAVAAHLETFPAQDQLKIASAPAPTRSIEGAAKLNASLDVSLKRLLDIQDFLPATPSGSEQQAVDVIGEAAQQAKRGAQQIEAACPTPVVQPHADTDRGFSRKWPVGADVLLSLVSGAATSVAYTATIYSDTWGSAPEIATAFTAGFLTPSVTQWAALPIFRSLRWQSAGGGGAKTGDDGGGGQAAAAKPAAAGKPAGDGGPPVASPADLQ